MPKTAEHPDPHVLTAFGRGGLPADQLSAVAEHVAGCDSCCAALGKVPDDTLVGLARQAVADTPAGHSVPAFAVPIENDEPIPAELADHPRYKVLAELGAGGMGVVYKAEHTMMGRVVALKVMAPHLTAKAAAVDRFHREVKAAAKLMHPNIVTAHDADSAGGLHFLVMEYVDGVSLDRLVKRRGPLPVTMAAQITRQAALGLQHAADKDMVHRDIKPQNLMVSRKGQVKILDFGLARFARDAENGANPQATAQNLIMGTPEYLSPEQAKNSSNVDPRSDIYSLGGTLYFLLTARVPFPNATSLIDKLLAHTQEEPVAVRSIRPDVPDGLARVVEQMMAKNPDDRFPTAAAVAAALAPFTKDAEPPKPFEVVDAVPVAVPVAETDTAPDALVPNGPTLAEQPRPRKYRRKPVAAAGTSKGVKWLVGAGVAAVALLVVVGIAKPPKKPPVVATGGGDKPVEDKVEGTVTKGNPTKGGGGVVAAAKRQKVLFIIPTNGVWLPDHDGVRDVFAESTEAELVVTAATKDVARPHAQTPGPPVRVHVPLWTIQNLDDYAAVMLCGGDVSEYLAGGNAVQVKRILDRAAFENKPIGGLCLGVRVLGQHGHLRDRTAARPIVAVPDFAGVTWREGTVVVDRKLVTGSGPDQAGEFARAVLRAIGK